MESCFRRPRGDAASATGLIPFFKKCLSRLPETVEGIRVRADAGFYSGACFDLLEARDIKYAIAARMTKRLGRCLRAVSYGPVAAACAPKVVEKVVKETVVKEVEKVVKETVIVEGAPVEVTRIVKETVVVEVEKVPPGSYGPMYSEHNHEPSIVECPNGDLLAVWYSCMRERGRENTLLASRLRYGNDEWDPACPFWDAPDRNMTGSVLWRDGDTLYHFGGISAAATWGNMIIYMRTSQDSGASWSKAEIIVPDHANGQVLPINLAFRAQDGSVVLPCDDGTVTGTKLYTSRDNCKAWLGSKGHIEGIHAGVVQLKDGRLLAFGRRKGDDPRAMPQSISDDMGATWKVSESPFDPVFGGQRPVLMRLRGGPLLFISFAKKMSMTDICGTQRTVSGLFGALSYDEGLTWPVRRLISDDGPGRWVDGGAWTGRFIMSHTFAEPRGYLAAVQAANGLIHLVSSRNHYVFCLKWLETPPPEAQGDDLA